MNTSIRTTIIKVISKPVYNELISASEELYAADVSVWVFDETALGESKFEELDNVIPF